MTAVGYHWRYLDTVEEAQALLADEPAAAAVRLLARSDAPAALVVAARTSSGGQMVEQATHILDLARYLVGEVDRGLRTAGHTRPRRLSRPRRRHATTASLTSPPARSATSPSTCLLRWSHRVGLHLFADGLAIELTDRDIMVDVGRGRPVRGAEGDPVVARGPRLHRRRRGGREPHPLPLLPRRSRRHRVALAIVAVRQTRAVPIALGSRRPRSPHG